MGDRATGSPRDTSAAAECVERLLFQSAVQERGRKREPLTQTVTPSPLLQQVRGFLPQLQQANMELRERRERNEPVEMEMEEDAVGDSRRGRRRRGRSGRSGGPHSGAVVELTLMYDPSWGELVADHGDQVGGVTEGDDFEGSAPSLLLPEERAPDHTAAIREVSPVRAEDATRRAH
eukprot:ctg_144.g141